MRLRGDGGGAALSPETGVGDDAVVDHEGQVDNVAAGLVSGLSGAVGIVQITRMRRLEEPAH